MCVCDNSFSVWQDFRLFLLYTSLNVFIARSIIFVITKRLSSFHPAGNSSRVPAGSEGSSEQGCLLWGDRSEGDARDGSRCRRRALSLRPHQQTRARGGCRTQCVQNLDAV